MIGALMQRTDHQEVLATPAHDGGTRTRLAIYIPSLEGGGAERMMATLANGFVERGHNTDLVLGRAVGPYLDEIDPRVRIIGLGRRVATSLFPLANYLRQERPRALLSALTHANVISVVARTLAGRQMRLVLSERVSLEATIAHEQGIKTRLLHRLMRITHPRADRIVVVAEAMVAEVERALELPPGRVVAIPNPVVTPDLLRLAVADPAHPFAKPDGQPLVLGVGRLTKQKDFATLIRAFEQVTRSLSAKLLILGEGEERPALEALVRSLGLSERVAMPGFEPNPFAAMRRASVFALSSRYEGLPGALIQAMAVGAPVVSTDCQTGPAEILENGRWGTLVPVGDSEALATALLNTIRSDYHPNVASRAQHYSLETAVSQYLSVLEPE